MKENNSLCIVIPCYNEEAVLPITAWQFLSQLNNMIDAGLISPESKILFVDDGSKDRTWEIIQDLAAKDPHFCGIQQSRNRGHQRALLAGLMEIKDTMDISITIDCDGQDDMTVMEDMVKAWHDGCDVVYGVRSNRDTDTWFKRTTAQGFYKFLNLMGAEVVYNHADYRLLSSRVLQSLADFQEVNLFLRGMIPLIGFKSTAVSYSRQERIAGTTHYPLSKMIGLALDGITSLSIKPIRMITWGGIGLSILSFVGVIWAIWTQLTGNAVQGWASTLCVICFIGGLQLISLGVLGEYIGKIYLETKKRPSYIISARTGPNLSGKEEPK